MNTAIHQFFRRLFEPVRHEHEMEESKPRLDPRIEAAWLDHYLMNREARSRSAPPPR